MTNQNNRGRTFWDFISENPRITFATIVILFSLLIFIIINKYTFKNNYFTLEPEKSENQKNIIVSDTISQNKTFKTPISKNLIIKKNTVPQEITTRNNHKKYAEKRFNNPTNNC